MVPIDVEAVLNHVYDEWELGKCSIRHYLIGLSKQCWIEEESFSGKRPFGDSGWKCKMYFALADGGFIAGEKDQGGSWHNVDDVAAEKIILACFDYLQCTNNSVGEMDMNAVETVIKLTDDQYKEARISSRQRNNCSKLLTELFVSIADKMAEEETDFWEQMHIVSGTNSDTHTLSIRWLSKEIVATPIDIDDNSCVDNE